MTLGLPLANLQRRGHRAWSHPKAVWAADFVNARYFNQGAKPLTSMLAVTRASGAMLADASGSYQIFANNELARVSGVGANIAGQLTSKIRDPRFEGGTVGVIGAGGILPTNMSATIGGLSIELVSVTTVGGVPKMRLRLFGVASSTTTPRICFDDSANAAAVAGQAWGTDCYVTAVAGAQPSIFLRLRTVQGASGVTNFDGATAVPVGTRSRYKSTAVLPTATFNAVQSWLTWNVILGVTYDFTVDVEAAKLVQLPVIDGPEQVVNGDLTDGTTNGWALAGGGGGAISNIANRLRILCGTNAFTGASQTLALALNSVYKMTSTMFANPNLRAVRGGFSRTGGANFTPMLSTIAAGPITTTGYYSYTDPTSNVLSLSFNANGVAGDTVDWDNISVKLQTPGYLPAYPILPPVGTPGDSTRFADDVVATLAVPLTDATEFALGMSAAITHIDDGVNRRFWVVGADVSNRLSVVMTAANVLVLTITNGGSSSTILTGPAIAATGRCGLVVRLKNGAYLMAVTINGVTSTYTSAATVTWPPLTYFRLGTNFSAVDALNDNVCGAVTYGAGMTDAEIIAESVRLAA